MEIVHDLLQLSIVGKYVLRDVPTLQNSQGQLMAILQVCLPRMPSSSYKTWTSTMTLYDSVHCVHTARHNRHDESYLHNRFSLKCLMFAWLRVHQTHFVLQRC